MTYVLSESLNWLGWLAAAVIILGTAYLFYRQRKKKESDTRSHHIVLLDGFPIVHIPISLSRERAEKIAANLQNVYTRLWASIAKSYCLTPAPMPIATIGSSLFEVDPEHPHVLWIAPRDKVFLRVQPTMYYWFARELHNIFRYRTFGMQWIYVARDEADDNNIIDIEQWIKENFSKEKTEED